jgi:hypothetical protein
LHDATTQALAPADVICKELQRKLVSRRKHYARGRAANELWAIYCTKNAFDDIIELDGRGCDVADVTTKSSLFGFEEPRQLMFWLRFRDP